MPALSAIFLIKESPRGVSYDEACELEVTPQQAKAEIDRHGADTTDRAGKRHQTGWEAFVADVGQKPRYLGQEVLDWLGY